MHLEMPFLWLARRLLKDPALRRELAKRRFHHVDREIMALPCATAPFILPKRHL